MDGLSVRVVVSGCALSGARCADMERHHQQNRAMRQLYDAGCRRIVAPKLMPRTGDAEVYLIRGFIE
jgi:hypothetical protein